MFLDPNVNPLSLDLTGGMARGRRRQQLGSLGNLECRQFISTCLLRSKNPKEEPFVSGAQTTWRAASKGAPGHHSELTFTIFQNGAKRLKKGLSLLIF
jgi:hypothetical protein